jgi:mono/diheme cytochrome c family protein
MIDLFAIQKRFSRFVSTFVVLALSLAGRSGYVAIGEEYAGVVYQLASQLTQDSKSGPSEQRKDSSVAKRADRGPATDDAITSGTKLFSRHCAACHGQQGDGKGIASNYLFPRPRNIRKGRFRLVSTKNNVPTREDLQAVLLRGMPGSSMPSWAHLSKADRDALIDEVMRLRREGAREDYVHSLQELDGLTEEEIAEAEVQEEIEDHVNEFSTPGESAEIPAIGPATSEAIANGKSIYNQFGCVSCHGATGTGDGVQAMLDEENLPTSPRDFTLGIFKGNPAPDSLYRRIAYGMPGTPMPGSSTMSAEQMVDLVHYIRSLSTEQQREAAILRRTKLSAKRVAKLPASEQSNAWASIKPSALNLFPLWWRTDGSPDIRIQAAHNGQTLAVRLSWKDATNDDHSLQSESFKDAVAVQLYQGDSEPFLGMGAADAPVDVWFWDADRQNGEDAVDKSHPNVVVDVLPFTEKFASRAEIGRPGTLIADQPDLSLPARASGNLIVPKREGAGGSSLQGGGPGSVTFRLPRSQLVQAHGTWADDQWAVVLKRPLSPQSSEDGIRLRPGSIVSVAFAVWDGSHCDRNGQKLITIWHDLSLER